MILSFWIKGKSTNSTHAFSRLERLDRLPGGGVLSTRETPCHAAACGSDTPSWCYSRRSTSIRPLHSSSMSTQLETWTRTAPVPSTTSYSQTILSMANPVPAIGPRENISRTPSSSTLSSTWCARSPRTALLLRVLFSLELSSKMQIVARFSRLPRILAKHQTNSEKILWDEKHNFLAWSTSIKNFITTLETRWCAILRFINNVVSHCPDKCQYP